MPYRELGPLPGQHAQVVVRVAGVLGLQRCDERQVAVFSACSAVTLVLSDTTPQKRAGLRTRPAGDTTAGVVWPQAPLCARRPTVGEAAGPVIALWRARDGIAANEQAFVFLAGGVVELAGQRHSDSKSRHIARLTSYSIWTSVSQLVGGHNYLAGPI